MTSSAATPVVSGGTTDAVVVDILLDFDYVRDIIIDVHFTREIVLGFGN